jgi:hypothetical protein
MYHNYVRIAQEHSRLGSSVAAFYEAGVTTCTRLACKLAKRSWPTRMQPHCGL